MPEGIRLSSRIASLELSFFDPETEMMVSAWGQEESRQQSQAHQPPPFIFLQVRFAVNDEVSKDFVALHQLKKLEKPLPSIPGLATD